MLNKRWIILPVVYRRRFASKAVFSAILRNSNHGKKPISLASPSCRPGSVQLNLYKNMKRQIDPYSKEMKK